MAVGLTQNGKLCSFEFKLGTQFEPGAGVAPTHGGFLMCGKRNRAFSVSKTFFILKQHKACIYQKITKVTLLYVSIYNTVLLLG